MANEVDSDSAYQCDSRGERDVDREYVERVRWSLALLNHLRPWIICFNVMMLIAVGVLAVRIVEILASVLNPAAPGGAPCGFFVGVGGGVAIGLILSHILHSLIFAIGGGMPERLLLKYYDAFNEKRKGRISAVEECGKGAGPNNE